MPELTIVMPYQEADRFWNIWAESEQEIDFRKDCFKAERCTTAFAALELKSFLGKMNCDFAVHISNKKPEKKHFIELNIEPQDSFGGFKLVPSDNGLLISGHCRNGLLNGIYEFLRMQGWRWLEPGIKGECRPDRSDLKWPEKAIEITPSFKYRGIDAFRESQDSVEYLLWMARNRLNVGFRKAATGKLADKLGMFSRTGGHLLQRMLRPDRYLETGKTIWEEHPEWYGLPENGIRRKNTAPKTQLCISQPDLLEFIGQDLLKMLNNSLRDIDIVDVWGFDTWGAICNCPDCRKAGNGADHNLRLLSALRKTLDKARQDGLLDRKVLLGTTAYEGTVTLTGPENPLPEELRTSGDICIFYPIRRCYRHGLDDEECEINRKYKDAWLAWNKDAKGISIWSGEYYNVSKYEDLPLLFSKKIPDDMRFYYNAGGSGATYMHAVFVNWAMRSLTQMQHAQYSWNINTHDEDFLEDYFRSRYGNHASEMRKAYALIEKASADISAWRNWGTGVLDILMTWDGTVPRKELKFGHFQNSEEAIRAAGQAIECYRQAAGIIDDRLKSEQAENWKKLPAPDYVPVNPLEMELFTAFDHMEYRLGESRRLLKYGIDTMRLLTAILNYYNSLLNENFPKADGYWEIIENTAREMNNYFLPVSFENPGAGLISKDALTRTQFRPLITRCRGARLHKMR